MARRPAPAEQLGLLEWEPPKPVARFADEQVRAASIANKMARAIALSLKESKLKRGEIAASMSAFLGVPVSTNMLNAYASQAREDHVITVTRFVALLHATGDRRLLEMLAELFGWTVVEKRFLKMIELAAVSEREDEDAPAPETKVVRLVRGNTALAPIERAEAGDADFDEQFVRAMREQRAQRGQFLSLVEGGGDD